MMICNDRRWPESWRVLGLQGVELVCVGYKWKTGLVFERIMGVRGHAGTGT